MHTIETLVDQLLSASGELWFLALIGQFFVMICEAAKPKPEESETSSSAKAIELWVGIFSLATPLLLFFHAFLSGRGALVAIIAAIGGAIILATLIGWFVRAVAPPVGRVLNRAAPFLAIAVFALAVYVSRDSIFGLIRTLVEARAAAV
jgi:hypothetical protein